MRVLDRAAESFWEAMKVAFGDCEECHGVLGGIGSLVQF